LVETERPDAQSRTAAAPIGLADALVHEVEAALARDDAAAAAALAAPLHAADLADLLQLLTTGEREALVRALGPALDPDTLTYLAEDVRDELIELLGPSRTGEAVARLETDDAVEVLSDLDEEEQAAILAALPLPDRAAIEEGLAFPEYSAGRLMQREVVAVPDHWSVGQCIDYLRATPDLPDEFYDIIIVDPRFHPVGAVPLSRVLRSRRAVPLKELRLKELRLVPAEMDQEQVAFMFRQYGLVTAPVVSPEGRLLGVITVDDVVDVIDEEAEDDLLKLGGVQETDLFAPPWRASLKRLPWLSINVVTAIIASVVIAQFDYAIARVVALAILMPIVASMGGNAGMQTLTVTVRALAVKEVTAANTWRVLLKELGVGMLNGTAFWVVGTTLVLLWFGDWALALVFGTAILINLVVAALAGLAIPLTLDRLRLDPAVASSVFLTTVTDVIGFFAFLGLAAYFLF
jgi:magnesium transporter